MYGIVRPMANSPPKRLRYGSPVTSRSAPRSVASSTIAAATSRACRSTGSSFTLNASAISSAESRTCCTSSDRPAMSASSGSVQSISTTWTAISSALVLAARLATSRTIRASLGPPLRASTARWNCAVSISGMEGHDTTATVRIWGVQTPPRGSLAPVRDVRDDGVLATEDGLLEPLRRLVVEDPFPPVAGDVLGEDDDRDRGGLVGWPGLLEHVEVRDDRRDHGPIGRFDDHERHARDLPLPALADRFTIVRVLGHEDRPDIGTERPAEVDRLDDRPVDAVDRDDDALLAMRAFNDEILADMELALLPVVLAPDEQHHADEDRDEHDDEPRAVDELHARHDHGDDGRGHAADRIDDESVAPASVTGPQPVPDHARLAYREVDEHADGVERDQGMRPATRDDDQGCGDHPEQHDAHGERQPVAAQCELAREEAVLPEDRREPRERGE